MTSEELTFSQILAQLQLQRDGSSAHGAVHVPQGWTQGRALFGGLVGALVARAAERLVPEERGLRSLLTSFVGPVQPGEAEARATLLRSGRAVAQVEAQLVQQGEVRCSALASFAADRASELRRPGPDAPSLPPVSDCFEQPYLEGVTPPFTKHFATRWGLGQMPFSGSSQAELGGYCRFREEKGPLTVAHVIALVDAWPPPTLPMLKAPAPSSSVTWMLDLVRAPHGTCDQWCSYRAEAKVVADGYAHADAALWAPDGRLLALGRQLVAVFD